MSVPSLLDGYRNAEDQANTSFLLETVMSTTKFESLLSDHLDATFADTAKLPLMGPDNHATPHYGIVRTDRTGADAWFPVTVKKGYVAHTTDDVKTICLAAAQGFGVSPDEIIVEAAWAKNGHRVCIQPTKDYRRSIIGSDTVWPRFIVRANYGGKFTASAGMFRDACSNMQMMRRVEETTLALRHTSSFRDHFDSTVKEFQGLAAKYENVVEAARMLADRRVAVKEFVAELFPVPENAGQAKQTRYENKVGEMIARLTREQLELGQSMDTQEASPWMLANMVTGYVQHDKGRVGKVNDVERMFLAVDDRLCDRAWDLAFTMAG